MLSYDTKKVPNYYYDYFKEIELLHKKVEEVQIKNNFNKREKSIKKICDIENL